MFKRLFTQAHAPEDHGLDAVADLLGAEDEVTGSNLALTELCGRLPGDVRGYLVAGAEPGEYHFLAAVGYPDDLLTLPAEHGPWRDAGPRIVANLIQELFSPNSRELKNRYSDIGLRDSKSTLVVPVGHGEAKVGAMVLHRHGNPPFSQDELRLARRWGQVLAGVLGLMLQARKARQALAEFAVAFVEAMEAQDFAQLGHGQRVAAYATALGNKRALTRRQLTDLYFGALLHDIGKLGNRHFDEDSEHPQRGANLVASASALAGAANAIRAHHERFDGTGYPEGLMGQSIPLLARIVAVADQFDMLSSERGRRLSLNDVEKVLAARSGHDLDPELVADFLDLVRCGKETAELAPFATLDLSLH